MSKTLFAASDFTNGLQALDEAIGNDYWLSPFTPITLLSAGGFIAVTFLRCRQSTEDFDYLLEPQWAYDDDVKKPLNSAIENVAKVLEFDPEWANEDMGAFVSKQDREHLFQQAEEQNIVLWQGENLKVLAAPLKWALERKLRRLQHNKMNISKRGSDLNDALALLKYLKDKEGTPLEQEHIRTLNITSREMPPDQRTMEWIAEAYQAKYGENVFV